MLVDLNGKSLQFDWDGLGRFLQLSQFRVFCQEAEAPLDVCDGVLSVFVRLRVAGGVQ